MVRFFVVVALARALYVDALRRRRRRHSMKSGAWCKSIQSGAALGGITASILIFYSGNGTAKFSKKGEAAP